VDDRRRRHWWPIGGRGDVTVPGNECEGGRNFNVRGGRDANDARVRDTGQSFGGEEQFVVAVSAVAAVATVALVGVAQ
jgi:hypothetical protein